MHCETKSGFCWTQNTEIKIPMSPTKDIHLHFKEQDCDTIERSRSPRNSIRWSRTRSNILKESSWMSHWGKYIYRGRFWSTARVVNAGKELTKSTLNWGFWYCFALLVYRCVAFSSRMTSIQPIERMATHLSMPKVASSDPTGTKHSKAISYRMASIWTSLWSHYQIPNSIVK
jgi:hypothetical protein